jgi:opacity protein-like surface antigen
VKRQYFKKIKLLTFKNILDNYSRTIKSNLGGFMKKIILFATGVVLLLSTAVFAAENTGVYVGISGGYVIPQTLTLSDPDNSASYMDTELKNGYLGGVKVGWNTPFTNRILAVELEYNYIYNEFDNDKIINLFGVTPATIEGDIQIHALLLNFKARYPEGRFHPYIGFGVGYAYFEQGDLIAREPGGPGTMTIQGESGDAFCYQLLAGLDFDITPNFGVGIGYKYVASKPTIGSINSDGIYADVDYKAHIVTLGLTYTF